jgi:hypothetical protein
MNLREIPWLADVPTFAGIPAIAGVLIPNVVFM